MGLRFRKSKNLGGGFRINVSKKGIGYSWGVKGYRITKKAGGGTRKTYSVPGTGLSWVDETYGKNKSTKRNGQGGSSVRSISSNTRSVAADSGSAYNYSAQNVLFRSTLHDIVNASSETSRPIQNSVRTYLALRTVLCVITVASFFLTAVSSGFSYLFLLGIIASPLYFILGRAKIDRYSNSYDTGYFEQAIGALEQAERVWLIHEIRDDSTTKEASGQSHNLSREPIILKKKKPFFLKTKQPCYLCQLYKCKVYLLPDWMLIKNNKGWSVFAWSDLQWTFSQAVVLEEEQLPNDTMIQNYVWQFANQDGSPDRRYVNNQQLPTCIYGLIRMVGPGYLDLLLYTSNPNSSNQLQSIINYTSQMGC